MDKRKNKVVLSLGGNIGEVKQVFKDAIVCVKEEIGEVVLLSSIYKTKAWGVENQPDFLNQVILIETLDAPQIVLQKCLKIEAQLGRVRKEKWQERVIDIDVLFYNDELINSEDLTVPHPFIHVRNFILYPLTDLMPEFVHPKLKTKIIELKNKCKDNLAVVKI
ncbi:MAG: 2-amino-4-hydroxy-6-hydroxymethyldihydropteridine diphosphokinase [Vicingaceae bacterium]